jgi:serine/threonine protein kinase
MSKIAQDIIAAWDNLSSEALAETPMAHIYKVVHNDQTYVLKAINPNMDSAQTERHKQYYRVEHALLAKIGPEIAIPKYCGYMENVTIAKHNYSAAQFMTFIEGESLKSAKYVHGNTTMMSPDNAAQIIKALIATLNHLNEQNFYHTDIASRNVIIENVSKCPFLIDFTGSLYTGELLGGYQGCIAPENLHLDASSQPYSIFSHQTTQLLQLYKELIYLNDPAAEKHLAALDDFNNRIRRGGYIMNDLIEFSRCFC